MKVTIEATLEGTKARVIARSALPARAHYSVQITGPAKLNWATIIEYEEWNPAARYANKLIERYGPERVRVVDNHS